ncbi:MAG: hypothetical protein ACK56F_32515, partial [bacterium]
MRTVTDFGHAARTTAGIASATREHADNRAEPRRITPDVGSGGAWPRTGSTRRLREPRAQRWLRIPEHIGLLERHVALTHAVVRLELVAREIAREEHLLAARAAAHRDGGEDDGEQGAAHAHAAILATGGWGRGLDGRCGSRWGDRGNDRTRCHGARGGGSLRGLDHRHRALTRVA